MANTSTVHRRVIKDITEGRSKLMEEYGIYLAPEENNMYNVHFVMPGPDETPFEGGLYHGMIRLNPSHPLLPPNVYMFTPSGRFNPSSYPINADNRGICFSYSSYHPEMWTPVNDIYKVMIGFISFMTDLKDYGAGCVDNPTDANIRNVCKKSIAAVKKDPNIKTFFPELYTLLMNDSYVPPKMGELNKKTNKVSPKVENGHVPPPKTTSITLVTSKPSKTPVTVPSKNKPANKQLTKGSKSDDDESDNEEDDDSSGDLLEEAEYSESDSSESEESSDSSEEKPAKKKVTKKAVNSKPIKKSAKKTVSKGTTSKPNAKPVVKKTNKKN